MRVIRQICGLALADYLHEGLLSACAVLSLAAMLTPLLVLFGVQNGIISTLRERLMADPRTLELIPEGGNKFGPDWMKDLAARPETRFVLPQTRTIAATMQLRAASGKAVDASLIATAAGDPLLSRWDADPSGWLTDAAPLTGPAAKAVASPLPISLSQPAAQRIDAAEGAIITGHVSRRRDERIESQSLPLRVAKILPLEVQQKDAAYISLSLLVALENYRDGFAVPALAWTGDSPDALDTEATREYPTFRLYAKSLDAVEPLRQFLISRHVLSRTQAEEIARVQSLDSAFGTVFALITGAALAGFLASTAGSALAGVRRKSRSLGIIRLQGFPRAGMVLFPLVQTLITGLMGTALASLLYLAVAYSIDVLFAASLPAGGAVCTLLPRHFAAALTLVLGFSALAGAVAAWRASTIEPSEVIRDV